MIENFEQTSGALISLSGNVVHTTSGGIHLPEPTSLLPYVIDASREICEIVRDCSLI